MSLLRIAVAALLFAYSAPSIAQQVEPCLPALQPNTVALDRDTAVNLILLDERLQTATEEQKTGIFGAYGDAQFGYDDAANASSTLKTLLNINYSRDEQVNLRLSTLPREAVDAYLACLDARGGVEIPFALSSTVGRANDFLISFWWSPERRPDDPNAHATLVITQGSFDNGKKSITVDIADRDPAGQLISATRNRFEPSEIAIRIPGSKTVFVEVPALPKMQVVTGVQMGDSHTIDAVETSGDVGKDLCVTLPNDASNMALIPGTFRIVWGRSQFVNAVGEPPPAGDGKPSVMKVDTSRQACAHVAMRFNEIWGSSIHADAQAKAEVFIAVPAEGAPPSP